MKKFELTQETKTEDVFGGTVTLHRIRALKDFGDVKAGDLGGWVEHEDNLSQDGDCWVYDDGMVSGKGMVQDDGLVSYNGMVSGDGMVCGNGVVSGNGWVSGNGKVCDNGWVCDNGVVCGNGWVCGNGVVSGYGVVSGNGKVCDNGMVCWNGVVCDNGWVCDNGVVQDHGKVCGNGVVSGNGWVSGNGKVCDNGEILKPKHIFVIDPIGSSTDYTTFYRTKHNQIAVTCGCFRGSLDDFARKVQETHGNNQYGLEYKKAIEQAKSQIDLS